MAKLSDASIRKLATCDTRIQMIVKEAIKVMDFSVLCGHRSSEEQDDLFRQGLSKKAAGTSKHNIFPSLAIDIAPFPIDFKDRDRYMFMAGVMFTMANRLSMKLRWGGDWNGDGNTRAERFQDLGHFEIAD